MGVTATSSRTASSRIVAGRVPELRRLVCLVVTLVLLNTY